MTIGSLSHRAATYTAGEGRRDERCRVSVPRPDRANQGPAEKGIPSRRVRAGPVRRPRRSRRALQGVAGSFRTACDDALLRRSSGRGLTDRTFGGALEARKISAAGDRLTSEAVGEIETEDGVLRIRRIHVRLNLKARPEDREVADRVHGFYKDSCPVYR